MSALSGLKDSISGVFARQSDFIRRHLFGANNERIDFIMDSFYKLNPGQRSGLIAVTFVVLFSLVAATIGIYFKMVDNLESELNESFTALHELKRNETEFKVQSARFDRLVDTIKRKVGTIRFKPFFEAKAKNQGINLENLSVKTFPLRSENPLSENFERGQIEMRIPNISIPKLMKFVTEVEKSGQFMSVKDLKIRGLYGTKLFFDAELIVLAYKTL